jgi:hypothetical protein
MGAGLGHLTRTLKTIKALALTRTCLVINNNHLVQKNSEFLRLKEAFRQLEITLVSIDPTDRAVDYILSLITLLQQYDIDELYIDCFPIGIYGELNGLSERLPLVKLTLISRYIKWESYQHLIKQSNQFEKVYYVEDNSRSQLAYLSMCSQQFQSLLLPLLKETEEEQVDVTFFTKRQENNYCLIVHSGSNEEVCQLISYAIQKLRLSNLCYPLVLASPWGIPDGYADKDIVWLNMYPINSYIKKAAIVVSAAGFNLVHEVSLAKKTHWLLPFERKYDDQFARKSGKEK